MSKGATQLAAAVAAAAVLLPASAIADVFLNGVNITGVTGQTFEKATVRIDAQGHVHIDAPGYAVSGPNTGSAAAAPAMAAPVRAGRITGKYYLVTSQEVVGATSFDIDLYVNAKWIRKLRSGEGQIVADLSRYLERGQNKVLLMAKKNLTSGIKSRSPNHTFRVVIGEGEEGGNNVMIEKTLIDFRVNAAQMEDVSREFTINVN